MYTHQYERDRAMRDHEATEEMIRMRGPRRIYNSTGCADAMVADGHAIDEQFRAVNDLEYMRERYRLVCFALCKHLGIKPDEVIADSGEEAWQLVGYEEANKVLNTPS